MKKFTSLMLMLLCAVATFAQVNSELAGKKISAIGEPATEVVDGQWYILNNVGRGNYVSEETTAMKMRATNTCETGSYAPNKAGYLFKFTKVEGDNEYWNIVSGNGKYFALGWNSSSVSNTAVKYVVDHQDAENNPSVFFMYDDENKRCADGQSNGGNFVGYSSNYSTSTTGNDAYRLLPVTLEENIVDFTSLNNAISAVNETLVNGGYTITLGDAVALQIDNADAAGYLSVSHPACDGDVLANAIDDSKSTLYHSSWLAALATPYMQVDLGADGKLDAFMLNYSTRQSGNNAAPYAMTVSASNDGENFTTITKLSKEDVVNALPASNGHDYSAFFIADQAYRYLRFTVTSSPNSNNSFGVASFGIQKATVEGDKSGLHMRYATIFKAMNDANPLLALGNAADQNDVNTTATNLTNIVSTIRLTAAPFETTTDFENPVCYLMKSARAESNWTNPYWKYDANGIVINQYDNAKDIVTDENAYWFFVEDDKTGALTMYAAVDPSSSMGYKAVTDGKDRITNNVTDKVGSAYQLVIKDGSAHPYALRPYGKNNYVSNHGGGTNRMGFYNDLNDTGTRFALVKKEDVVIKTDAFTWATNTTWTDAEDLTSTVLNDNALGYGIKYIDNTVETEGATKFVVTLAYTTGNCALNVRGVEVIDANGHIVAGDYHVGKTGTNTTCDYTVKVAEAGEYKVRVYATFGAKDRADATNGNITVAHSFVDESAFAHNVTFAAEYATLYLGYKVAVPAGVEAYVVNSTEKGYAEMVEVENVIPANTAVILKNVGTENTYTFAYTADEADEIEENLLNGSIANRYVTEDAYVLAIGSKGVGFYKAELNKLNETAFLNNANKAYLAIPASENSAAFYGFDWAGTTDVENVVVENEVKAIYDLTGRKVETISAPGIYIVGGKKTLVK